MTMTIMGIFSRHKAGPPDEPRVDGRWGYVQHQEHMTVQSSWTQNKMWIRTPWNAPKLWCICRSYGAEIAIAATVGQVTPQRPASWYRTQRPTAMSCGGSEFYSATVCAWWALVGLWMFERVGIHHDYSVDRRRVRLHWHGNAFGTWAIEAHWNHAFCTATLGTTRSTNSRQRDDDRAVSRHHDKTLLNADAGDIGFEDCLDESDHRSDDTRVSVWMDPNSDDCGTLTEVSDNEGNRCMPSKQERAWQRPMIIRGGKFSVENLTRFQRRFAIEACDVLYELVAWWLLRACSQGGCAVEFDSTVTRTGTLGWTVLHFHMCAGLAFSNLVVGSSSVGHQHSDCHSSGVQGSSIVDLSISVCTAEEYVCLIISMLLLRLPRTFEYNLRWWSRRRESLEESSFPFLRNHLVDAICRHRIVYITALDLVFLNRDPFSCARAKLTQ